MGDHLKEQQGTCFHRICTWTYNLDYRLLDWYTFLHWIGKAGSKRCLLHHSSRCHCFAGSWSCSTPSLKWSLQPAQVLGKLGLGKIRQTKSQKYVLIVSSGGFQMIEDPGGCFHHFSHLLACPQSSGWRKGNIILFGIISENISVKNSHFFPAFPLCNEFWLIFSIADALVVITVSGISPTSLHHPFNQHYALKPIKQESLVYMHNSLFAQKLLKQGKQYRQCKQCKRCEQ